MKKISLAVLIVLLAFTIAIMGCARANPVASVNGQEITEDDIQGYVDFFIAQDATGTLAQDQGQLQAVKSNILDSLIVVKLLEQYARDQNIEASQQDIQQQYDQVAGSYPSPEVFEQEMENRGISTDFLKAEIRDQMLRSKIFDYVTQDIQVTEEEVEQFYQENKDTLFYEQEKVRVSHILAQFGEDMLVSNPSEEERQRALEKIQEAKAQVDAGKSFEDVARDLSEDRLSAENGGDIGYISRGEMYEEFEAAAFSLQVGQVSDIVETGFGYHILIVTDHRQEHIKEFDQVRETAESLLENEQKNDAWTEFIYGLLDDAQIEYHTDLRSTLVFEEGQQ